MDTQENRNVCVRAGDEKNEVQERMGLENGQAKCRERSDDRRRE